MAYDESLPNRVTLITTGFTDEETPRYFLKFPGEPILTFDKPIALPHKITVRVTGKNPVHLTPDE